MTCYELWSIIVGAFGAIATLLAVIVALWQTKYANKKKIKLSYTETVAIVQDMTTGRLASVGCRFAEIDIVNIGNRKVVVDSWSIYFSKRFSLQIIDKNGSSLPLELDIEQGSKLRTSLHGIKTALIENQKEIEKYKNKKIVFAIYDSTGKRHIVKSNRKIADVIKSDDSEYFYKVDK